MSDVIHAQVMQDNGVPIASVELFGQMACNVVVNFGEILPNVSELIPVAYAFQLGLTDTKKLVVPSARSKVFGNSFSQVSSPYMTSFPGFL